ncbi:MAG: indolepyruvate ferredoxin oxidoreductase subunit alpha [Dissulfuribacterales bacterium]
MHQLLKTGPTTMLLLGNEAIVRGALEAGVRVTASYPGTPSSEIGNNLFQIHSEAPDLLYFEFSVNEKVAMEVAAAAAAAGVRSLTCMKHVGMNVASDAMMSLAYVGVRAGMVIVCADDPSIHSSQNEQDNRFYGKMSFLPILEPASPQEMMDLTKKAFELSEALELPVILRTTTRTAHVRGPVQLGSLPEAKKESGRFQKDAKRWVLVPGTARLRRKVLLERFEQAMSISDGFDLNEITGSGDMGIVASGVSRGYVMDAIDDLGCKNQISCLFLVMTHPLPEKTIADFVVNKKAILVVEELEPFLEEGIRAVLQRMGVSTPVYGKNGEYFSRMSEFNPALVRGAIARFLGCADVRVEPLAVSNMPPLPIRPPSLCKGCPHTETYNIIKETVIGMGFEENVLYPTDIGCYTLGVMPPIQMADYLICMGSSVGSSAGFSVSTTQKVISFIGDSTFFHSGVSSLINAVHQGHHFCLVILDNSTTAMTGHQPNPGIQYVPPEYKKTRVTIEQVVRGCGVRNVFKINPYKKDEALPVVRQALSLNDLVVIISEAPCVLYAKKVGGRR